MKSLQLAKIALLFIAAKLGAFATTITQTSTVAIPLDVKSYRDAFFAHQWTFSQYDPTLGPLTSAHVLISWYTTATVFEVNPFNDPPKQYNWTPAFFADASPAIVQGSNFILLQPTYSTNTGPVVSLAPGQSATYTGQLSGTSSTYITNPSQLSFLVGYQDILLHFSAYVVASNDYGGMYGAGGFATATITYNVPDAGTTAGTCAAALLVVGISVSRRRRGSNAAPALTA